MRPPSDWDPTSLAIENEDSKSEELVAELTAADEASETGEEETKDVSQISYPTQEDGTVMVELPVYGRVVRRISLYGSIMDSLSQGLNLGKLFTKKTKGTTWNLVGKIRGEKRPTDIKVEVSGIPGLVARVERGELGTQEGSFKIVLELTEKLEPAIYNRDQAGTLKVIAEGMPEGDNLLEFAVNLSVLKP